ncbi:hypothetical protein SAY87_016911 [Trapa incisa]|uniref:Uncharacterized protein n=1 Tax=Trapa incisa TaxID=236973 RepID=A0AAN7LGJ7_9MYRT|nr:hypothetical protein SAY87_016911 [Trapa incisa]
MPRWAFWGGDRDSSIDDAMKFNFNLLGQNEPRPAIIIDRERQTERHWRCDHQIKPLTELWVADANARNNVPIAFSVKEMSCLWVMLYETAREERRERSLS